MATGQPTPQPKYKTYKRGESGSISGSGGTSQQQSSYPQIRAATGGSSPGSTYTTPQGVQVETQAATSYPEVAAERQRLINEATAQGTATTSQQAETQVQIQNNASFQQYSQAISEYEKDIKRQGYQNAAEYFAAVRGQPSPRQTSYPEVAAEIKRLRQTSVPVPPAPKSTPWISNTTFYDENGAAYPLSKTDKKIIATAEKVAELENQRAERYKAFEENINNPKWNLNPFQKFLIKTGYAVGVGYGETLASVGAKTYVFVGAETSPILKKYARAIEREAVTETGKELAYQYDLRTGRGWGNLALTAASIYGLGKYKATQRARAREAIGNEPQPSEAIKAKFNIKNKDVSPVKGEVTQTKTDTSYYGKTGAKITKYVDDAGKVADELTEPNAVLTERGSIKTGRPGSEASVGLPTRPNSKVTISYAGDKTGGVTTTTVKGTIYNYEAVTYASSKEGIITSPLGYQSKTIEPIYRTDYFKINKLTGKRTYLGATQAPQTSDLVAQEPVTRPSETITTDKSIISKEITDQTIQSKTNPRLKLDIETTKITSTSAQEKPSNIPAALKTPKQSPGTIIKESITGDLDATPIESKIKITTSPKEAPQPNQIVKIEPLQAEIKNTIVGTEITTGTPTTTTTPAVIETTTGSAQKSIWQLSFENKNLQPTTPSKPILSIKFKEAPIETPILRIKIPAIQPPPTSPQVLINPQTQVATQVRVVQAPTAPPTTTSIPQVTLPPQTSQPPPAVLFQAPVPGQEKRQGQEGIAPPRSDTLKDYKRIIKAPPLSKDFRTQTPQPTLIGEPETQNQPTYRQVNRQRQTNKPATIQKPQLITETPTEQETIRTINPPRPREKQPPEIPPPIIPIQLERPATKENKAFSFAKGGRTRGRIETIKTQKTNKGFTYGQHQRIADIETTIKPGLLSTSTSKKKKRRGARNGIF